MTKFDFSYEVWIILNSPAALHVDSEYGFDQDPFRRPDTSST